MGLMPMSACSMGDAVAVIATAHATSPIAGITGSTMAHLWFVETGGTQTMMMAATASASGRRSGTRPYSPTLMAYAVASSSASKWP